MTVLVAAFTSPAWLATASPAIAQAPGGGTAAPATKPPPDPFFATEFPQRASSVADSTPHMVTNGSKRPSTAAKRVFPPAKAVVPENQKPGLRLVTPGTPFGGFRVFRAFGAESPAQAAARAAAGS